MAKHTTIAEKAVKLQEFATTELRNLWLEIMARSNARNDDQVIASFSTGLTADIARLLGGNSPASDLAERYVGLAQVWISAANKVLQQDNLLTPSRVEALGASFDIIATRQTRLEDEAGINRQSELGTFFETLPTEIAERAKELVPPVALGLGITVSLVVGVLVLIVALK